MDTGEQVAIIGGGISGLSAAYELSRRGIPFRLFERSDHFGGVIRTDIIDGFTIDGGPDSLLTQKPAAIALCEELGLGPRLQPTLPPQTAYVLKDGHLCRLPEASVLGIPTRLGPLAASPLLSAAGKVRMAMELKTPRSTSNQDESVGSFFRRRFGEEAVTYLAEPLLAGIHAGDVERLSMRALFPRLVDTEREHGSLIRRFRTLRATAPPSKHGQFRSLPDGLAELTRAILEALGPGRLYTGHEVVGLSGSSPYQICFASGERIAATQVILTVPAYVTARIVSGLDPDLGALCLSIPYSSTATVALSYPSASVGRRLNGTGFVVPRAERQLSVMAGSWVSSKWPHRAPEGHVLLRGFVGGARDPDVLDRTDAELIKATHQDFQHLLEISGGPGLARVYRWPRLNPQHEVGHLEKLAAIDAQLAQFPGLLVTGAGFRGVGIPDCVTNGRAAAVAAAKEAEG